ncbi:MAG: thrombospondin type 3 repeat-containing protein, partial [Actinomycetota bacterium]
PFALTEPATTAVEGLAMHPQEAILFAADYTGLIRALAVTPGGGLLPSGAPPITIDDRPEGLAVSPDGSVLAVSFGTIVGLVRTYRIGPSGLLEEAPGSPVELMGSQFGGSLAFSADGSRLFVASMSTQLGRIHGFAVLPGGELEEEPGSPFPLEALPFPEGVRLSPDGSVLYATDPFTRVIASLRLEADGSISSLGSFTPDEGTGQPSGLEPTPDGAFLLTTNFSHRSVSVLRVGADGTLSPEHAPVQEADDDGLIDGGVLFVSADPDRDGLSLEVDNCPEEPNDLQQDRDADGIGDVCDACVARFDPAQLDTDGDGLGDSCDPDADADGEGQDSDNCSAAPNAEQTDTDGDGRGDACDNCPDELNASQADADADAVGDACADRPEGFLYVNTNGGQNSVASFLVRRSGRLEPLPGSPFRTGGSGSLGSSLRLAFPGVALAMGGRFLYATNADTRSVAGFTVLADGTLRPVRGSPFNIGALGPASMAVNERDRMLYIGFSQALGLQSMRIEVDGSLSPAPGFISMPGLPAAMALGPDGRHLVVSLSRVQFNEVHALPLDAAGVPRLAQIPPFVL